MATINCKLRVGDEAVSNIKKLLEIMDKVYMKSPTNGRLALLMSSRLLRLPVSRWQWVLYTWITGIKREVKVPNAEQW